ncbi:hypothetical protein JCM21531_3964 [Acetivibrio straminisolvens JCM 21531]|uniref:Uncharacterized protein n=2 Tax=Acetivibrio straminisolvens TaxID=253314 RepID=W4VAZ0_9FIRM|nr:hypothetical protein JCM21531_3964 [Acetivibrio straminisolvens JCM 21531]
MGSNEYGQLGDGTGINRIVPVPMDNNPIFTTIVSGFSAKAEQNGIKLFWNLKTEDYVYGYKIYRAEDIDGPYTLIAKLNRSAMEYLDKDYEVGNANEPSEKAFYYKISAIDKFDNESNKSEAVSVLAKTDSIAPVVLSIEPVNNTKIASRSNIYVRAEDNFGISNITLQYSLDGTEWIDISTQNNGSFLWNTPDMNGTVYVRAIARDLVAMSVMEVL